MTLLEYLEKHLNDFEEKTIINTKNDVIYRGLLQNIPFDIPIYNMEIVTVTMDEIVVKIIA